MGRSNRTMRLNRSTRLVRRHGASNHSSERMELTASACRFARGTSELVDDKLTFSATLMRAGEVDAARRLLAEVEQEVGLEKDMLMRRVNEVTEKVNRKRGARRRLASLAAVSVLGALAVTSSTIGMAVGLFSASDSRESGPGAPATAHSRARNTPSETRPPILAYFDSGEVRIGGVKVVLRGRALKAFRELKSESGASDPAQVRALLGLLPRDVREVIEASGVDTVTDALSAAIERARRKAGRDPKSSRHDEPAAPAREAPDEAETPDDPKPSPKPSPTGLELFEDGR